MLGSAAYIIHCTHTAPNTTHFLISIAFIYPWLSYALLLCLGVNVQDSGVGPKNISDILTQSWLSPLANSVSEMIHNDFIF